MTTGFGEGQPHSCGYARNCPLRDVPINTLCTLTVAVPAWAIGRAITWIAPTGVRPCNSEGHSASALGSGSHHVPPDSLTAAVKRTRPLLRLWLIELPCLYHNWDEPVKGQKF